MTKTEFLREAADVAGMRSPLVPPHITFMELAELLVRCGVLEKDVDAYHLGDLEVLCPVCNAPVGEECVPSPSGPRMPCPHPERRREAQKGRK